MSGRESFAVFISLVWNGRRPSVELKKLGMDGIVNRSKRERENVDFSCLSLKVLTTQTRTHTRTLSVLVE